MVTEDEASFMKSCKQKIEEGKGKLKTFNVHKKTTEVEVKDIQPLTEVVAEVKEAFPGLVHIKMPMCNSASLRHDHQRQRPGGHLHQHPHHHQRPDRPVPRHHRSLWRLKGKTSSRAAAIHAVQA